ncbi:MAG: ABC transporter permease [Gammaproteobacteria bacterium]|nr:ABC transporter permease [Gammaproteobacteria bacterium]
MQLILNRAGSYLSLIGLGWFVPVVRIATGDSPREQLQQIWRQLGIPVLAIGLFVAVWAQIAPRIDTSLGAVPGPAAVWGEAMNLVDDHREQRERRDAFYERQHERNAERLAEDPDADVRIRDYTGKPSYFDQIMTSLKTVFTGFLLAALIGVPLGILAGLSPSINAAVNPLVQVFKPVSPLAWLPIVTMVVSALYVTDDPMFDKSFVNSAITVTLCSLWPALINTALGVASIDKDLLNVGRVLKLGWWTKVRRIVLPSALPLIFTGLRLSLGVGWMVLIAAEMLAQNPGLGKFVWDEFQNGSSESLARILVAVFTIGLIGFLLDRVMLALQTMFTHTANR